VVRSDGPGEGRQSPVASLGGGDGGSSSSSGGGSPNGAYASGLSDITILNPFCACPCGICFSGVPQ